MSQTSTGYSGKTNTRSGEAEAQQNKSERESMWGAIPGEIIDFDPATQKALIQPLYKPKHAGTEIVLPILEEVMVHFDHGKKGGLTYPVQPGDRVVLVPQMRNTELYHTEDSYVANDARSFSLSDMEAYYEGGLSLSGPIPNFDDLNTNWRYDEMGVFGWFGSETGQTKCQLAGGELLTMMITVFAALATEPSLANGSVYSTIAQQLTVSKLP